MASKEELDKLEQKERERAKKEEELRKKKEQYKEAEMRKEENRRLAEEASYKLGKKKGQWYTNPYYLTFGGLGLLLVYVCVMMFVNRTPPLNKVPVIDEKKIEEHNNDNPWNQGASPFWEGATLADAKRIFTTGFASHSNLPQCKPDENLIIPESFDSRTEWPSCMVGVVNQNRKCDGSYAIAVTQSIAEHLCIKSKEHILKQLSAQEILSCDLKNQGCRGGALNLALDYTIANGLADEKCFPYQGTNDKVTCENMCTTPMKERIGGYCVAMTKENIKKEIMKGGPVIAVMQIYSDFLNYKSGIYVKGDEVPRFSGMHAVKVVGWGIGTEEGENQGNKYWIIQNSWGPEWGENGYAKIQEDQEFLFEQYVYSVMTREEVMELRQKAQEEKNQQAGNIPTEGQNNDDMPDVNLDDQKDDIKDENKNN